MTGGLEMGDAAHAQFHTLMTNSLRRAGESLTLLLGHPVHLTVSGMESVPVERLAGVVREAETEIMGGVRFQIVGEAGGQMVLLFPIGSISRMLRILLAEPVDPQRLSADQRSAMQEVGNILASSFLSAMGDSLGMRLLPTPPEMHLHDVGGLIRQVIRGVDRLDSEVLLVRALFEDPEHRVELRMFVLPEAAGLAAMFEGPQTGRGEQP